MSFDMQITNGKRAEVRLCANDINQNNNRFAFTPDEGRFHSAYSG